MFCLLVLIIPLFIVYNVQNKTSSRLTEMSEERKVDTCTIVEHEELREQLSSKETELSELKIEHDRLREQYERKREENYRFEVCTQMYNRNSITNLCITKASKNSIVHHCTSVHHSVSQCSSVVYFNGL